MAIMTDFRQLLKDSTHPQWHPILLAALESMDKGYLAESLQQTDWLPEQTQLFAAFRQPLDNIRCILLGESPYPRAASANGMAFWDAAVGDLWCENGMSRAVNRATSLRNFLKMLLLARGDLQDDFSQQAIARLDKSRYWKMLDALFSQMLSQGFLLLNASLVYSENQVAWHARQWRPFIRSIFQQLAIVKSDVRLILFGRIAARIPESALFTCVLAEHPYNLSFITNAEVLAFFKPMDLLSCHE